MWDKPTWLNWLANSLLAISLVAMLYVTILAVVHLPIFHLREVVVEGQLNHVNREQVKLIVAKHLKGNFFTLDLIKARNAFKKLPWARNVSLRRRWSNKLEVVIEEHKALARWGSIALVNTHGELFYAATNNELPVFLGPGDGVIEVASQYMEVSKSLKMADLTIATLALSPRRAWQVTTTNGMVIELGRVDVAARLDKFVRVYRNTIASINMKEGYADLRYPTGFAVRRPVEASAISTAMARTESLSPNKQSSQAAKKSSKPTAMSHQSGRSKKQAAVSLV
ncbi:FtsQ Cell division septal protein [Methylophilaceae bacterium]